MTWDSKIRLLGPYLVNIWPVLAILDQKVRSSDLGQINLTILSTLHLNHGFCYAEGTMAVTETYLPLFEVLAIFMPMAIEIWRWGLICSITYFKKGYYTLSHIKQTTFAKVGCLKWFWRTFKLPQWDSRCWFIYINSESDSAVTCLVT